MERYALRTAGLSLVLCAGMSLGGLALAPSAFADQAKADPAAAETAPAGLADGEYVGTGKGIGGKFEVTVTVEGGKISAVEVGENSETQGIGSKAIDQLPALIVEAGGTEGVDGLSGATVTSKAIFSAVEEALEQAAAPAEEAAGLADGEYVGTGKGIGGKFEVTVTIKDGKISAVEVGENSETEGIGSKAIEQLPALIVEANGLEGVDGLTGATVTSKAIFSAVEDCIAQATPAASAGLTDGEYVGTGKGIGGKFEVTVTVKDGKISAVEVGDNAETQGIGSKAIDQLPALIVEANGTEGVDGLSGATVTSKAIFSAVEEALAQAGAGDEAAEAPAAK